jgi:hypothetical protein
MLDFDVQRSRLTCGSKSAASLPAASDDCGHRLIIDAMPDPVQHAPGPQVCDVRHLKSLNGDWARSV